ncbi:hypothetical protein QL285_031571 [Trifolium repens]|nr:hypothetical protein QL285_031571 [Trifolium repens]
MDRDARSNEAKYLFSHRALQGTKMLNDILWAHLNSIKLLNKFTLVVIIDSTNKTNKYRIHLLEFVGSTCTGKMYSIAFAFLTSEKEDNLVWALRGVLDILQCQDDLKVIVTNRDQALMKAVDDVFTKCIIGERVRTNEV